MSHFRKTLKGFAWMGFLRGSTRVIAFLKIAILARLLTPSEFGIYGVAFLVLAFLEIATETGVNVFLIQEKEKLEKFLDTAWLVSIFRGFVIFILVLAFSSAISEFFNLPASRPLLVLISFVPLIKGFINPAVIGYQKELEFNKEFWFRFVIFFVDALTAVVVALFLREAISLIWGLIAGAVLEVGLSFYLMPKRPAFNFELSKAHMIIKRGKWVTLYGLFNYLFEHSDDIVVGKILGSGSLGVYQNAYKISTLPLTEVSDVFVKVTFPVYSKLKDIKAIKETLKKTFALTLMLVIPFGVLIYVFAEPIVMILLGPNWTLAIPVLKVLAAFGVIRALTQPFYALFLALQKQEYVTGSTLISIAIMLLTLFPLMARYGIVGAALSALCGSIAVIPAVIVFLIMTLRLEVGK